MTKEGSGFLAKRRIKDFKEEVTVEGNVGIGSTGIKGKSTSIEYDAKRYEEALHSLREAKEAISSIDIDQKFIEQGTFLYSKLSKQGKEDLAFFMTGKPEILRKKYAPGTNAIWIAPYVEEYLRVYEKTILNSSIKDKNIIPFIHDQPIGVRIILSEMKGVMLEFVRRTQGIEFGTVDMPFDRNITFEKDLRRRNLPEGATIRTRSDENPEILWQILYANDEDSYFTLDAARTLSRKHAEDDMQYYRSA